MKTDLVGYKLIKIKDNSVIEEWGGVWGQCPGIPNPIVLPNGDQVCAPQLNVNYSGYKLIIWEMQEPPPSVPASVPLWAIRVVLMEKGLLEQANIAVANSENAALKVIWEYGNYVDSDSPALKELAQQMNISDQDLNTMLIEAGRLKI